jgi:hypothetical protein
MGNRGFWVPGPGLTLNAYGNVSAGTMVQILSDLKAFGEVGFTANRTAKTAAAKRRRKAARYFIMEPSERSGRVVPVVWVRKGGIDPARADLRQPHQLFAALRLLWPRSDLRRQPLPDRVGEGPQAEGFGKPKG